MDGGKKLMNENNRRGGKGVCYSRSRGGRTGHVEIHQLHQLMNLTRCGCASVFFFFLPVPNAQKMTWRVRGSVQQCDTTFLALSLQRRALACATIAQ